MQSISTKKTTLPDLKREGVYVHSSGQYVARLGFELNLSGRRVRAFQYLGNDPDEATIKHIAIVKEWKFTKANWAKYRDLICLGLPDEIREVAEIDLPVWVKPEWVKDACKAIQQIGDAAQQSMLREFIDRTAKQLDTIDDARTQLKAATVPPPAELVARLPAAAQQLIGQKSAFDLLPPELQARLFAAIQPPAHETMGFAANAERLTVAEAKKRYLDDCRSRIGLPEDGIKAGTFQNIDRLLRLSLDLKVKDASGIEQLVIDPAKMLHDLTRDDLIAFKRGWLAKVGAGDISKRTAANYVKALQYFLAWVYKRDRIVSRRVPDLDELFRFTDVNPINIANYDSVKDTIKLILAKATDRVKLYVYLALNCGMYQTDIGHLKHDEVIDQESGTFIIRRREKTSHQNDFASCHWLWPETAKLLKAEMAAVDVETNPHGLALLNEDGKPLYVAGSDKARVDNITCAYWRVVQSMNEDLAKDNPDHQQITLSFKQYRKLGATAMNRIGDEQTQKLYRAASFEGADRFYVRGDFTKLTAALKTWRKQLKKDGVLA